MKFKTAYKNDIKWRGVRLILVDKELMKGKDTKMIILRNALTFTGCRVFALLIKGWISTPYVFYFYHKYRFPYLNSLNVIHLEEWMAHPLNFYHASFPPVWPLLLHRSQGFRNGKNKLIINKYKYVSIGSEAIVT